MPRAMTLNATPTWAGLLVQPRGDGDSTTCYAWEDVVRSPFADDDTFWQVFDTEGARGTNKGQPICCKVKGRQHSRLALRLWVRAIRRAWREGTLRITTQKPRRHWVAWPGVLFMVCLCVAFPIMTWDRFHGDNWQGLMALGAPAVDLAVLSGLLSLLLLKVAFDLLRIQIARTVRPNVLAVTITPGGLSAELNGGQQVSSSWDQLIDVRGLPDCVLVAPHVVRLRFHDTPDLWLLRPDSRMNLVLQLVVQSRWPAKRLDQERRQRHVAIRLFLWCLLGGVAAMVSISRAMPPDHRSAAWVFPVLMAFFGLCLALALLPGFGTWLVRRSRRWERKRRSRRSAPA